MRRRSAWTSWSTCWSISSNRSSSYLKTFNRCTNSIPIRRTQPTTWPQIATIHLRLAVHFRNFYFQFFFRLNFDQFLELNWASLQRIWNWLAAEAERILLERRDRVSSSDVQEGQQALRRAQEKEDVRATRQAWPVADGSGHGRLRRHQDGKRNQDGRVYAREWIVSL